MDDEGLVRETLRAMLASAAHEVAEATNGKDVVHYYEDARKDLLITDTVMPEMDGLEEIRALGRIN
ncbi:MAG: response regulator, partial [Planctomycetota bacterium]